MTVMKFGRVTPDASDLTAEHNLGVYRTRFSDETKKVIDARLIAGDRPSMVARELSLPFLWVYNRMYHLRKQRRLCIHQSRPKPEYERARRLWNEGATYQEIADAYGYTFKRMAGVIQHYRKQFGWFPRRNKQ